MARWVVCCDGTWQGVAQDSNVRRLSGAYVPAAGDAAAHYVPGVGTSTWNVVANLRAGLTGAGLDSSILDGYDFLVRSWRPGDEIALFGFSRGAYTARSLAGMIGRVGLVDGHGPDGRDLDEAARRDAVRRAYRRYRAIGRTPQDDTWHAGLTLGYTPGDPDIPVRLVGVWDTVGALGIPTYLGVPDLGHSRERYEFLDVALNPHIPFARHAVSLDERRGPFRPTLWSPPAAGQDMVQAWFPGDHCDVGGGNPSTQLSDVALEWMAEQAAVAGLRFDLALVEGFDPSPLGPLHGADAGMKGAATEIAFQLRPRAVPRIDAPDISRSARTRHDLAGYRPTTTLEPGESATVTVAGAAAWTETGLWLVAGGRYRFEAKGDWRSAGYPSGPAGDTRLWHLSGRVFSSLFDGLQKGLQAVLANPEAALVGSRRQHDLPWMSLVGQVANESPRTSAQSPADPDQRIPIGEEAVAEIEREGYLHAYPNDALGFYGNNSGEVTLTVTRTA
ncbi:hypothetical protein GCM10009836_39880 [Pseudonocardia ailaonensis]|uniref:T6SS Phospholipase effector Tle1-like catalytic domain-containing protein n=1 Tax=Pseudonocardia ailaonensis TaxID=367279 RepID=A0ABN2N6Z3_9PSEU